MSNQFSLMRERRFYPFFYTQFLGAFNDNVFKTALITLVAFKAGRLTDMDGATLATLLPGLFILPFFLFSATAGQLADKFEKSFVIRSVKIFEVIIMLFASVGFLINSFWILVATLFMMGVHSTIFGPVKYGYLPQHLNEHEIVGGNGMVEMGTFAAILLGQVLGAWLAMQPLDGLLGGDVITGITIIGLAVLGYLASRGVPDSPAAAPGLRINWNPVTETFRSIGFIWSHQQIWLAIIGISWFWFFGATLLAQFPNFSKLVLGANESIFILLLTVFTVGVGTGSLMCEKLSRGKVEVGLVPIAAIGLTLFCADLYLTSSSLPTVSALAIPAGILEFLEVPAHWRILGDILLIGLAGGIYIVPLYALIQTRAEKSHQSRVIAANNILNAFFMVISAVFSVLLFKAGLSIPELFLSTALLNIVVIIHLCIRQPEYARRMVAWLKPTKPEAI